MLKLNPNINECEDEDSEEPSRLVIAEVNSTSVSSENGNNHETAVKITNNNTEQHHQRAAHPPPPHFAIVASL